MTLTVYRVNWRRINIANPQIYEYGFELVTWFNNAGAMEVVRQANPNYEVLSSFPLISHDLETTDGS